MTDTVLVNFHCHSIFSDGELTPEALVANMSASGVKYAALTDHDSLEGLPRFVEALHSHNIAGFPGVELTTWFENREVHLLGYGFDPTDSNLIETLRSIRQIHESEVLSIAGSLRKKGSHTRFTHLKEPGGQSAAPQGKLELDRAIDLVHRAGGRTFLAHPQVYESNPGKLEQFILRLKELGLDGIEALTDPDQEPSIDDLAAFARKNNLLICAGTDIHDPENKSGQAYAIEMPRKDWIALRSDIFSSKALSYEPEGSPGKTTPLFVSQSHPSVAPRRFQQRGFILRILLPTLLAIGLFLGAIWGIILPSFENSLLDRKRELIQELTNSAWSILASYERDVQAGLLDQEEAQALAAERIGTLRYGPEGKDYFWIQDLQPRMIMHPYRSELNGQDLSTFTDARGVRIFVEFANLVRQDGEGYIDYVWQWKDDPSRLEPKQSYIRGFEPWGWVIGTGIYVDDVNQEIARIEKGIIRTSLVISGAVVLLLLFVLLQSLRIEHQRQEILDSLRESTERYYTLAEATTEGTLLILDGRCRYANPIFLSMSGYTVRQLEFLELTDLLPHVEINHTIWHRFENANDEHSADGEAFDGILQCADGSMRDCLLALNRITVGGQQGLILLARDITRQRKVLGQEGIMHAAQAVSVGIFRARASWPAPLVESNPAAQAFFPGPAPALADLVSDFSEFEEILHILHEKGEIKDHIIHSTSHDSSTRFISLSAKLVEEAREHNKLIDGTLLDVSEIHKEEVERQALIERLQASLLFLHSPIIQLGHDALICDKQTSVTELSQKMTSHDATAVLVNDADGEILGIVTDHDLRERVLAENMSPNTPIHEIMSAHPIKISENALVYEALIKMEENGIQHLAVEASDGEIVSVIDNRSLIQFPNYGPIVLNREILRAVTVDEIALKVRRVPSLARTLLESSARPQVVTNMMTTVCDSATQRLVQLAMDELGPSPVSFAFIGMGSQGRQEQTLLTDQDNGIIFAAPPAADLANVSDYFLRLGKFVCDGLEQAGYTPCRGGVMAANERWCRSLPGWISGFEEWVEKAEPQEIINLSIFFDFRTVFGEAELTQRLRLAMFSALKERPSVFNYFAQNALQFRPPFRLLGNVYLGGGSTEHGGEINLKDAMMPIVAFARLYALRHSLDQTHTMERIDALVDRNVLHSSSRDEMVDAYNFLMQLRLQTQVAAIQAEEPPSNLFHPGKLGYSQKGLLKQAFAQISAVQKKISYDFLGGT